MFFSAFCALLLKTSRFLGVLVHWGPRPATGAPQTSRGSRDSREMREPARVAETPSSSPRLVFGEGFYGMFSPPVSFPPPFATL